MWMNGGRQDNEGWWEAFSEQRPTAELGAGTGALALASCRYYFQGWGPAGRGGDTLAPRALQQ
ncbi:hypothetical protein J1614_003881 [Plenodomus biglobosus]|nr:hypothetical protein J1614_003881 [Plenodomus biglobosus]